MHRLFVSQLRSFEPSNWNQQKKNLSHRSLSARLCRYTSLHIISGDFLPVVAGTFAYSRLPAGLGRSFTLWWMVIFIGLLMPNEPCASCLNWTHFMLFDFGASHRARASLLPQVARGNHPPTPPHLRPALVREASEWKALFTFAGSPHEASRERRQTAAARHMWTLACVQQEEREKSAKSLWFWSWFWCMQMLYIFPILFFYVGNFLWGSSSTAMLEVRHSTARKWCSRRHCMLSEPPSVTSQTRQNTWERVWDVSGEGCAQVYFFFFKSGGFCLITFMLLHQKRQLNMLFCIVKLFGWISKI